MRRLRRAGSGGAVSLSSSGGLLLLDCALSRNAALLAGGALFLSFTSAAQSSYLSRVVGANNTAGAVAPGQPAAANAATSAAPQPDPSLSPQRGRGGFLFAEASIVTLLCAELAGNAALQGGALHVALQSRLALMGDQDSAAPSCPLRASAPAAPRASPSSAATAAPPRGLSAAPQPAAYATVLRGNVALAGGGVFVQDSDVWVSARVALALCPAPHQCFLRPAEGSTLCHACHAVANTQYNTPIPNTLPQVYAMPQFVTAGRPGVLLEGNVAAAGGGLALQSPRTASLTADFLRNRADGPAAVVSGGCAARRGPCHVVCKLHGTLPARCRAALLLLSRSPIPACRRPPSQLRWASALPSWPGPVAPQARAAACS